LYSLQLPFLLILLGISAIRVMGGGEDWYDVWFSGEPYGWTTDIKEFFRCLGFVVVLGIGLSFLWAINPSTYQGSYPSYEESTPIKVSSSTSASKQKKGAHKNRVATKRHSAKQRRVSHLPGSTSSHQALSN
jgi:hypothetical protein